MLEFLARAWRALLSPVPTPSDRTEQAVRVIQRHLDEASRRRGGAPVEARELNDEERETLAQELAALLRSGERQPYERAAERTAERTAEATAAPEGGPEARQPSSSP
ncbi:MAG: hypothetical protein HYU88_00635 [Chloroflexi bacterium]|nr:hypothetical protein [Chloroflexota bacterium]MBI4507119.1 hypothetical protein [Chloroflexota bacterium]